jgi:hypothetical protein
MSEDSVGRRSVLWGAGATAGGVALGGLALAAPAAAGESHGDGHLSGSWRVDVHNDDGSETVSVLSFAGGQVCVVHDISPAGPPFTGTWRAGRHGSFRATVLTGFPGEEQGEPGPVIELVLVGRARHGRLRGSFTFRVTDPSGAEVGTGSGTFEGVPVRA